MLLPGFSGGSWNQSWEAAKHSESFFAMDTYMTLSMDIKEKKLIIMVNPIWSGLRKGGYYSNGSKCIWSGTYDVGYGRNVVANE